MNHKLSIDVIVPAFNEEDCVQELYERLCSLFNKENEYEFRVLIVENGSTDDTFQKLYDIHCKDPRFKIIKLVRNFRMDGGLTAGLNFASGDAVIFMTADLQDPPEVISEFLRFWEQGYKNIYAEIKKRKGTPLMRKFNSFMFYRMASWATSGVITKDASDFRLLDRSAYEVLREIKEKNRFMRGLISWLGYRTIGVPIDRPPRFGGKSKAYTFEVIDLALKGILAHSIKPLRFASILGFLTFFISVLLLLIFPIVWFTRGVPFAGFGSLVGLFLLFFSFLFIILGIMSEYLGLLYEEVKNRPSYIVNKFYD